MANRSSFIWEIDKEKLELLVKKSNSFSDIIRHFGIAIASGNYKTLKKRLLEDNIDFSHIPLGYNNNKNRKFPEKSIPLEQVMVMNSSYDRGSLKKRLIKNKIIENKCDVCGQLPEWNNTVLIMVLDHINGDNKDHRIENLRLLCPNCNSQQNTFCGKNNKKKRYHCEKCGKIITKKSTLCKSCSGFSLNRRKVKDRPSVEQLLKEVSESSYCAVGRKYGVSDKAIRKWIT
jgi:hypothetical protein